MVGKFNPYEQMEISAKRKFLEVNEILEMKNIIPATKNSFQGLKSSLDTVEKIVTDLEDITQTKAQRGKTD